MTARRQSGLVERLILRSLPCILLLLASVDYAMAADPNQVVNSYIRTRFADAEGLSSTLVDDIVQSQDGFLWLREYGTDLARFDGRHFEMFEGFGHILSLALAPNGDLWLGTSDDGLKQIPAAALNQIGHLPAISYQLGRRLSIVTLRFTRNGILWLGTENGLFRFEHGNFTPIVSGLYVEWIQEAANGHLWIGARERGPLEWDGSQTVPHPELEAQLGVKAKDIFHVFEDSHGVAWFCTSNGVARRIGGTIEKLEPYSPHGHRAFRVYEDPSGRIWFSTEEGLFRAAATGLELVAAKMQVRKMYGDRDGNLWVGTNGDGLFRFKDRAVRTFTTADGLPNNVAMTVLTTQDGALWAGFNCGGLVQLTERGFRIYNDKDGLLNDCVWSLAEDVNHDLWIGTWGGGVFRLHQGKFTQYSKSQGLASNNVPRITAARDGSLWILYGSRLDRMRDGQIRRYTRADGLSFPNYILVHEDRTGGIWLSSFQGLDHMTGERFARSPLFPDGSPVPLGEDRSGRLYFVVEPHGGMFRVTNNQPVQVAPDLDGVELLETGQGELWIAGPSTLRIPPGGFDHVHQKDEPLDFETFGLADGMATPQAAGGFPVSALTPDSKLWIATDLGLTMIDLARLPRTDHKPAIYIENVTVGRNSQSPGHELVLPAGTHHVELNFDAIEISSPEKIRLQYRLDSVDSEWLDAKPPGRAIYSNIPPGKHAFHVRASNRSGIWDRTGMAYYVMQQPYFYQTLWFLAAAIAFGLLLIAGMYQLRMRAVSRTLSARFEGQLAERTRIARELHDTLLQSFSALLLRLQSVSKILPGRPEEARQRVASAIEQASSAIAEGRDAVHELRSEGTADDDLAHAIGNFGRELLSGATDENPPGFRVHVEGTPRRLNPMLRDEVYRIAVEALRNAVRYAEAKQIEAEIQYNAQQLQLRIRDDGKGIDPGVLEQGHALGHWGLRGMRERARLVGGNLDVWSEVNSGTEIELTVPAASAYAKPASRWSVFSQSWRSKRP